MDFMTRLSAFLLLAGLVVVRPAICGRKRSHDLFQRETGPYIFQVAVHLRICVRFLGVCEYYHDTLKHFLSELPLDYLPRPKILVDRSATSRR